MKLMLFRSENSLTKLPFLLIAICFGLISNVAAQDDEEWDPPAPYEEPTPRTLFQEGGDGGLFWGVSAKAGSLNSRDAIFLIGGETAWIFGKKLAVGFAGYGMYSDLDRLEGFENNFLSGGYGGLFVEPIIGGNAMFHITFPMLVGVGNVTFDNFVNIPQDYLELDFFLIAEPGIRLETNVAQFVKMGITGNYRFTTNASFRGSGENLLNGWSFGLFARFGLF